MLYRRENDFDNLIVSAVQKRPALTVPLVKAIIAVESGFNPNAIRQEPKIGDASTGLMQVLYKTALGTGWKGTREQLLDPATNIDVGTRFLDSLVRSKNGDVLSAVSAYNNGHGKRATQPVTTCLARDQQTGLCIRSYTAQPGQFYNQPYVDKVVKALEYFGAPVPNVEGADSWATYMALAGALWLATKTRK